MIVDRRILACVVVSVMAHVAFARAMRGLPKRVDAPIQRRISIRVVAPPPPLEPPPEPASPQPAPPKPVPLERARPRRAVAEAPVPPQAAPPPEQPPAPPDTSASPGAPVFGVSMESTSQAGGGPSMPVGSPGAPRGGRGGGGAETKGKDEGQGGPPVPVYEVTTMPLPRRRCTGNLTPEARQAGVEGTVTLEGIVGIDGRVRAIHVLSGLGYGLDEAAIAAIGKCLYSPGRKGDVAVPVTIREFKVRFFQNDE